MAIVWDGTGGLFTDIGKYVGACRNLEVYLEDGADDAIDEMTEALDEAKSSRVAAHTDAIETLRAGVEAARVELAAAAEVRILDPLAIINELHLPSTTDLDTTLERIREAMVAASETVDANTVTLGTVTAGTLSDGNGTLLISKVLDGYNPPGEFFPKDREYAGLDCEMCAESETITVECVSDTQTGGRTAEGMETFRVFGGVPNPLDSTPTPYFGAGLQGSGASTDGWLVGAHSNTLLSDPGFESWTGSSPPVIDSWTLDSGTNDTHFKRASSTDKYRGTYGAQFLGDGAQATIQISQAMPISRLKPLARYAVFLRYKASAAVAAGTFGCIFTGTGYTAGGSESISIAPGSLATSWTLASFQMTMPAIIPTDLALVVKVTGTLTNAKSIWFDDVYVVPMKYFGGVAIAAVHGSNRTCVEDRWTFTVANDQAGAFQTFWARKFGRQLPSKSDNTETISDTLAEMTALAPFSDSVGP